MWEELDPAGELEFLTVYKRGAMKIVRRLCSSLNPAIRVATHRSLPVFLDQRLVIYWIITIVPRVVSDRFLI